jgi:hypothetical protein
MQRSAARIAELQNTLKVALSNGDLHATRPSDMTDEAVRAQNQKVLGDLDGYRAQHIEAIERLRAMSGPEAEWSAVTRSEARLGRVLEAASSSDRPLVGGPGEPAARSMAGRMELNLAVAEAREGDRLALSPSAAAQVQKVLVDDLPTMGAMPKGGYDLSVSRPTSYAPVSQRGFMSMDMLVSEGLTVQRAAVGATVAVAAVDAFSTAHAVARDYNRDNATAAEAKVMDFGSRTGGGVVGAALGYEAGTMALGPGYGTAIGGVAGYFAGDTYAQWRHREAIYAQDDAQGRTWRMDPEKPEQGWQRTTSERAPGPMSRVESVTVQADAALTHQLNAKATTTSLEMALGELSPGANPHRLSRSPGDATSIPDTPWNRDARTGDWTRVVNRLEDNGTDFGRTVHARTETANPERAAQLDAQSQRIIEANAARSAPVPLPGGASRQRLGGRWPTVDGHHQCALAHR